MAGRPDPGGNGPPLRIGLVDTGVNPWHSHVGGAVRGFRVYRDPGGRVREDREFRDLLGHGTAVAGVIRGELPAAEIVAVRVFGDRLVTYPTLVARGVYRAAAEGCRVINLSLGLAGDSAAGVLARACAEAIAHGCVLVAPADPGAPDRLPAALPGVVRAVADDRLEPSRVERLDGPGVAYRARGAPRDLPAVPSAGNLWGSSFASARVAAHLARRRDPPETP